MPSAMDVTVSTEWIKVMSVGAPGTGKSIFGSTFPTPGFVFDFAQSIISYKGLPFDYEQYANSSIGWTKFEKDLATFIKCFKEGKSFPNEKKEQFPRQYVSVIIDDLSAMTAVCMDRALQMDPKRSDVGGPVWNIHYTMVRHLMEGRLRQLMNLNCNIHFIAHLHVITDKESGNVVGVEPMLTGALPVIIPGYFDEVYYHTTKREGGDTKWLMQTVPMGWNQARSRMSGKLRTLPDLLPNDFNVLFDYLTGKRKKEAKPSPTAQPSPTTTTKKKETKNGKEAIAADTTASG